MKIIPFDIEKAKSGKYKIQTKDGRPVRIVCWDRKYIKSGPILGLIEENGCECTCSYQLSGKIVEDENNSADLVLVDESTPNIRKQIYNVIIKTYKDYPNVTCDVQLSTLLLADLIKENLNIPKWKRIHKGERLPETSYTKTDFHSQCFIPCMKGVEMGSDCWYLPVTVLNELENEVC